MPAQLALEARHGLRLRRLLTAAWCRGATAATCACASTGPCIDAAALARVDEHAGAAGMSVEFCGLTLAHPVINGSGTFDAIAARAGLRRGAARALPVRGLRLEDDHARSRAPATRRRGCGRPPAGLINSIGLPNKGLDALPRARTCPALADALAACR